MSVDTRTDPAFEILEINSEDGTVTLKIKKGILGACANQLKTTPDKRKGHTIIRKLGWELANIGDQLYGKS